MPVDYDQVSDWELFTLIPLDPIGCQPSCRHLDEQTSLMSQVDSWRQVVIE